MLGLIPAYAGSTGRFKDGLSETGAHPRLRGEHFTIEYNEGANAGSSPPTRGAPYRPGEVPNFPGLIPAYAGSTCEVSAGGRAGRAHPRLRGEHSVGRPSDSSRAGSSPPTRGALVPRSGFEPEHRLIPAYAGSTLLGN